MKGSTLFWILLIGALFLLLNNKSPFNMNAMAVSGASGTGGGVSAPSQYQGPAPVYGGVQGYPACLVGSPGCPTPIPVTPSPY